MNNTRPNRTYRQPLTLVDLSKATAQGRNGATKAKTDWVLWLLTAVTLIGLCWAFAHATDPRPEHGTKACNNAQDKVFQKHMQTAHHDHVIDMTTIMAETCK